MKIGFISTVHGHPWPGSEYLWAATANELLAKGHRVYAQCSVDFKNSPHLKKLIYSGLNYEPIKPINSRFERIRQKILDPYQKLKNWKPDLVVVSAGSAFDVSYIPKLSNYLLAENIPYILFCQFNAEGFWIDEGNRKTMQKIYNKSRFSGFLSTDNHRITERQLAQKINNSIVIRPPFPLQLEEPLPWPIVKNDEWHFACVARLESRWKGQDVLFEVLAQPQWKKRGWRLNLYGEGAERDYLEKLALHYGIADRVFFVGFVSDRSEIWRNNHIQVFPTRGEGGPMVLTEGMMAGRAVVISDCGNASFYVNDGVDGFLVEFPTAQCFSKTLEKAWEARNQWQEMGLFAHRKLKALEHTAPEKELMDFILSVPFR